MIIRHPNSVVSTDILPSTIFFCSHKLVDIVMAEEDSGSFHKVSSKGRSWSKVTRDIARRSWQHSEPLDTLSMALIDKNAIFIRVANLSAYMEANRWVMRQKAQNMQVLSPRRQPKVLQRLVLIRKLVTILFWAIVPALKDSHWQQLCPRPEM